jgi:outer membrane protein OmpA-like peptidoglycan-associated protein
MGQEIVLKDTFTEKGGSNMRKKLVFGLIAVFLLTPLVAYAGDTVDLSPGQDTIDLRPTKGSYFGVPNKAVGVPEDFPQTEAAIAKAEQSPGAKCCPEKLIQAKNMAKEAAEIYWACRTKEALAMLAEARKLARETELCKTVTLACKVLFAFDSAELTPAGKAVLDEHLATLQAHPELKVEIAGHTCNIGPESYNQGLSERRAKSVYNYYLSKGIAADRMTAIGYGETRPAFPNDTEEDRAKNRRVELTFK